MDLSFATSKRLELEIVMDDVAVTSEPTAMAVLFA